jgi:hypothetical protein
MKKALFIPAVLICCFYTISNAIAGTFTSEKGAQITIAADAVPGAQPIIFNPSTNVNVDGQSDSTSFAVTAWHEQAEGKSSGQAYGMAADSNKMFFIDISDANNIPSGVGTNSGDFSGGDWHTM